MKDLLISRVGRTSNLDFASGGDILDVAQYYIGALSFKVCILTTADRPDMGGYAGVDDDVFFARVAVGV